MSGAREKLIEWMADHGWARTGSGMMGELWRHESGREVIVPHALTPDSFEWAGVVRRIHGRQPLT